MQTNNYSETTALVVDDDPVMLEVARGMLARLGFTEILLAGDGYRGLELVSSGPDACDLLICDLDMPDLDGIEFLRKAAELGWSGSTIFMSGTDTRLLNVVQEIGRARSLGRLETLPKPLSFGALAEAIERALSVPDARRRASGKACVSEDDLARAIDQDQLYLEYQPKFYAGSLSLVGCEALVRWQHPSIGRIAPNDFVPLAERSGLVREMTQWVARRAMRDLAGWHGIDRGITLSINVSMRDLNDLRWPDWLASLAASHGLRPSQITLEVTESAAIGNLGDSLEILARLRLKGFGLSIDDFGTGFSSLEKLSYIPFTELKIDRRFVQNAARSSGARVVLQACADLARELSLVSVAEGVETDQELSLVREAGCQTVQGFLLGRPGSAEALVETFLRPAALTARQRPAAQR